MEDNSSVYIHPKRSSKLLNEANPNLPVPELPTFKQVQCQAKEHAESIFNTQRALVELLDKCEHVLIKRWMRKTAEQRRSILVAVAPHIPATHSPDFQAMRKEDMERWEVTRTGTQPRDSWLLPSINNEDLTQPRSLILFLRSRARNPPGVFVNADFNSIRIGHMTQAIKISHLPGYTMLLAGQETPEAYGRMLSWDKYPEALDLMSSGVGVQPGEGLIVMEIQKRKLDFLLKCAQTILQGLNADANRLPPRPTEVEVQDLLARDDAEWPSLSMEILEAPYRIPDGFEVSKLQALIKARRDYAEDHLWSLREDPSYFQDTILELSEHRQERILTADAHFHPILRQNLFWERVLSSVVVGAYTDLLVWHGLSQEIEKICGIVASNAAKGYETGVGLSVDNDFEIAIAHFSHYVRQLTKDDLETWQVGMAASPSLRRHFVRVTQDPTDTRIQACSSSSSAHRQDDLLWLMERLTMEDQVSLYGMENLCDELDREVRSSRASRDRVSPWIASLLSDLSLLAEIQRQIDLRNHGRMTLIDFEKEAKNREFQRKTNLLSQVHSILTEPSDLSAVALPLSKYDYPSVTYRGRVNTEKMQEAEDELDTFWEQIDRHSTKTCGTTVNHLLADILDIREVRRTPDWQPRVRDASIRSTAAEGAASITADLTATCLNTASKDTTNPRELATNLHQEPKTQGSANSNIPEPFINVAVPVAAESSPKFKVSKRSFKVFSTLFHTPSAAETPGETPWSEFLLAMASVGFSLKKLDGSAWLFDPVDDLSSRSIIFHEPHPSSRIPPKVVRRFGRRLERAFGWTSESFERALRS